MSEMNETAVRPRGLTHGRSVPGSGVAPQHEPVVFPVALPANEDIVFDFGEETVGWPAFDIGAGRATSIEIGYGEYHDEALGCFPSPLSWYHDPHDRFDVECGEAVCHSAGRRAFRYVRVTADAPLALRDVRCMAVGYPVERRGRFTCSDGRLNQIWEISERTTRRCMQAFYEDGVKRDGLLWIGDFRIQYLCNAMLYGDAALARTSLRMIAASQGADGALPACAARGGGHQHPHAIDYMPGIPSALEHWVLVNYHADFLCAVEAFLRYSGAQDLRNELADVLLGLTRYLCGPMAAPWRLPPHVMKADSFSTDNGHPAGLNGFHSHAALIAQLIEGLRAGIRHATALGAEEDRRRMERTVRDWTHMLRSCFFDEKTGRLRDEPADTPGASTFSEHAQAAALTAGLASEADVTDRWTGLRPVSGAALFHVLRGLIAAGRPRVAVRRIRDVWGRALDAGLTTCPEFFPEDPREWFHHEPRRGDGGPNDQRVASLCHGWSAGPAWLLPRAFFGVRPMAPGFCRVAFAPNLCGLDHIAGAIPTPYGEILVELERTRRGGLARIALPDGVKGELLPCAGHRTRSFRGRADLPFGIR